MCYWAVCVSSREVFFLCLHQDEVKVLASVVQRVDSAIDWINLYPLEGEIGFQHNYTVIPLHQQGSKFTFTSSCPLGNHKTWFACPWSILVVQVNHLAQLNPRK